MFVGLHAFAATALRTPEFEMTMDEGTQFTTAAQKVMRHYSVEANQKTIDWVAFAGVCMMLYIPRFVAIGNNRGKKPGVGHNGGPPMQPQSARPTVVPLHSIQPDLTGDNGFREAE